MKISQFLIEIKHKTRVRTRVKKIFLNGFYNLSQLLFLLRQKLLIVYSNIFGPLHKKSILFIIGVQRSGTSALFANLSKDDRIKAYNEFSELSINGDEKLRLHSFPVLKKQINKNIKPIILLKPLVETQNSRQLLDFFGGSKAVWIYRHYKDIANSNLNKFGINNGFNNLKPLLDGDFNNWRSENVPNDVRNLVLSYMSKDLLPHDAAALFWYLRSTFYFNLNLDQDDRVLLLKYDHFVTDPYYHFKLIYEHLGFSVPKVLADNSINDRSVRKGADIDLSPEIEQLCEEMYQRFEKHYQAKS